MHTKVGIVGMPNVGKSSLFKALTAEKIDIANYPFTTIDPNVGVVSVPDERLARLAAMSHSKKTVNAAIEFYDIAGLVKNAHQGEGLGNQFLSHIREVDAICEVVRVFETNDVAHVEGAPDPVRDIEIINLELILADMQTLEKMILASEKYIKIGNKEMRDRVAALQKIRDSLTQSRLANSVALEERERRLVRDAHLLTAKPFIFLLNIDEQKIVDTKMQHALIESVSRRSGFSKNVFVIMSNKIEADLAELSDMEREQFIRETHATSLKANLIKKAYETLGLITFFTTGEDESRAWTITQGARAPRAGRTIHSDFEEKFIRAEVIPWDVLLACGGWANAREKGKLQLVGKDYMVKDGDVIEFKI